MKRGIARLSFLLAALIALPAFAQNVTGSGKTVLQTSPTLVTPILGTPQSATLTNATGLPLGGLASQAANTVVGRASGSGVPSALSVSSCSTASSAVTWTTNTGFGCNSSITAAAVAVGGITGLGTGVATALAVNVGTAGSPVVNGGALGSPSSAGTIPAFTLGGTIGGGGNQLNNIIIGTSTPLAGAFTTVSATGTITPSQTNGIVGTTTNNSANAGSVGEYIESVVSAVSFPTSTQFGDAASISLTAGDWDVSAFGVASANGATVVLWETGISTTSGNSQTGLVLGSNRTNNPPPTAASAVSVPIPVYRVLLSGPTTVYFKFSAQYSIATPQLYGRLSARRVR